MNRLALILAGGKGTRLYPLTHDAYPKPMIPLSYQGRKYPFLEFLLAFLREQGVNRAVLCLGHKGEQIAAYFGDGRRLGMELRYDEDGDADTEARVVHALNRFSDDLFMVTCGDVFHPISLNTFFADLETHPDWLAEVTAETLIGGEMGNLVIEPSGEVEDYSRSGTMAGNIVKETGILVLRRSALQGVEHQRTLSLTEDLYPSLISHHALGAKLTDAPFFDIGTPEGYWRFQRFVEQGQARPITRLH